MRRAVLLFIFLATTTFAAPTAGARTQQEAASDGLAWLRSKQSTDAKTDGALPGLGGGYTVGSTADGVYAIVAAEQNPNDWKTPSGATPISYLSAHAGDQDVRDDPGLAAKVALAARLGGRDPQAFGGRNLIQQIESQYESATGRYGNSAKPITFNNFTQSLAILALRANGRSVPPKAVDYLLSTQQVDGGWEYSPGFGSDTNSTSMVVQALTVARGTASGAQQSQIDQSVQKAKRYFHDEQVGDGGFVYSRTFCDPSCEGEANSTALVIQAGRAAGEDPKGSSWSKNGKTPVSYLLTLQRADGAFSFQPKGDADAGATAAAIPAVVEKSFNCLIGFGTCPAAASAGAPAGQVSPSPSPPARSDTASSPAPRRRSTVRRQTVAPATSPSPPPLAEAATDDEAEPEESPSPTPRATPTGRRDVASEAAGGQERRNWAPVAAVFVPLLLLALAGVFITMRRVRC